MENIKRTRKKSKELDAPKKLKILTTIVDRKKVDFFLSILEGYEINMQTVMYAKGTAPTEIMEYMGLKGSDKAVIFSIVQENKIKDILAKYEDDIFKSKANKGIAFTIPIKSLIGVYIYQFLANIEV